MMLKCMVGLAILFALQPASAQDFRKRYSLIPDQAAPESPAPPGLLMPPRRPLPHGDRFAPGGDIKIEIKHIGGNLKVTGYDGESVEVTARKKGPNRDKIQITDRSLGSRVDLLITYPPFQMDPASIDCEVRVPKSEEYNFTLISHGNVEISNVVGRLFAKSDRGQVEIKDVRGWVNAFSSSGNVRVEIEKIQDRSFMRVSSISGNVFVSAPSNFDALVDISSRSGFLKSDFPIDIREARYGPGQLGRGKLGSGKHVLYVRSELGHVSLVRK